MKIYDFVFFKKIKVSISQPILVTAFYQVLILFAPLFNFNHTKNVPRRCGVLASKRLLMREKSYLLVFTKILLLLINYPLQNSGLFCHTIFVVCLRLEDPVH